MADSESSISPDAPATTQNLESWVLSNLALVTSGCVLLLTGIRLMRVSHDDPTTAAAILRYLGTTSVLMALLVTVVPIVVAAGTFLLLARRTSPRFVTWTLMALTLFLLPLWIAAFAYLVGVLISRQSRKRDLDRFRYPSVAVIVAIATVLLLTGDRMLVGYVLSESDDQTVVLRQSDRRVLIFASAPESRRLCEVRDSSPDSAWYWRTVASFISFERTPSYSSCERPT